MHLTIAAMEAADWPEVARIYGEGIATGTATFEHAVPTWEQWRSGRSPDLALVAHASADGRGASRSDGGAKTAGGPVLGWVALSRISRREVYRGVGQLGIYVDLRHTGRGVGRALLSALIECSEQAGFWMLQAGIFPENEASIALHRRCGFRLVGVRERLGRTVDGRWRDVALYERRSQIAGV